MLALAWLACSSPQPRPVWEGDTADTGTPPEVEPVVLPEYSHGVCPTLTGDVNRGFATGNGERNFRVLLPADPQGAGVVYAWHWLGGSAREILDYMDLQQWVDEHGFIVIAPDSSGDEAYEWDFLAGPDGGADSLFFEDLLVCTHATWGVDLERVYTVGMSAGGLWTTWLTLYRSEYFSASAPLSGGTTVYASPAHTLPVLVTWGGRTDTYQGFSFEDASETLSAGLQGDDAFVVECVHDGGHTIPAEATDYVGRFFADHPRDIAPEPYADGLPGVFPEWCALPGQGR